MGNVFKRDPIWHKNLGLNRPDPTITIAWSGKSTYSLEVDIIKACESFFTSMGIARSVCICEHNS